MTLNLKNKPARKLTLTIIQIILFEIWKSRNNNKYNKNLIPQHTIINKLNTNYKPFYKHTSKA